MQNLKAFRVIVLASAAALAPNASAQGLPTQKLLTLEVAQTIAQEALAKCRAGGYKVTVTVVDHANVLKAFLRDDGSRMETVENSRMKAYTVIVNGRASSPPANLPPGTPVPPAVLPGTVNQLGGLPILVGDQVIGAVAVSGAPAELDVECGKVALAKVADKLK